MKKIIALLFLITLTNAFGADVKISQLPVGSAASSNGNDSFPYVDSSAGVTRRLKFSDTKNIPAISSTFATIASPTFTGVLTSPQIVVTSSFASPLFVGALTGTASGNLTYTPNNHGVLASSATNVATVIPPGSSTGAPLVNQGGSSDPAWGSMSGTYLTSLDASKITTGTLDNARTTATNFATPSSIVARDGSSNFSAGTITASLTGTASGNTTYAANNHGVVVSSGTNLMTVLGPDSSLVKWLKSGGSSADPAWTAFTAPLVTTYASGSGTHTFTGSPLIVEIYAIGGGGGGAGSSTQGANDGGNGGTGGNTTFGSSLITASGGVGATHGATTGGAGGAASKGAATGLALPGGAGGGSSASSAGSGTWPGSPGANGPFGGAGIGDASTGQAAGVTNSGAGGSGGSFNSAGANAGYESSGGGAGGFVHAYISGSTLSGLSGSASYGVGAAGSAGSAGTSGNAGGAGGSGYLKVIEYYQ